MVNCLLCKSTDNVVITEADSKSIAKENLKSFKTDFSYLFNANQIHLLECRSCRLRFYNPPVSGDKEFYKELQKFDRYYREDKEEYAYSGRYIKKIDSVLDVACGEGEFSKFAAFIISYANVLRRVGTQ